MSRPADHPSYAPRAAVDGVARAWELLDRHATGTATDPTAITLAEWERRRAALATRINPELTFPDGRWPEPAWNRGRRKSPVRRGKQYTARVKRIEGGVMLYSCRGPCGRMLPREAFNRRSVEPDGISCYCRTCINEIRREREKVPA